MGDTKEFTTPIGGHKVVTKTIVTGYDQEAMDAAAYFDDDELQLTPLQRNNRKGFELLVVSVNDETDNTVGKILAMDARDYAFILDELKKLTDGEEVKKNEVTSSDTTESSSIPESPQAPTPTTIPIE